MYTFPLSITLTTEIVQLSEQISAVKTIWFWFTCAEFFVILLLFYLFNENCVMLENLINGKLKDNHYNNDKI